MVVTNQIIKRDLKEFTKYDYMLHENSKRKIYSRNLQKKHFHWGQLKLFLNELNFLNHYYDPSKVKDLVYVGAAGGQHFVVLTEMFPELNFHLFDTEPFVKELNEIPTIHIHNRYFGEEDIKEWKGKPCMFVSDIRNLKYDSKKTEEDNILINEKLLWEDMKLQEKWVKEINPLHSLLKFRLPFSKKDTGLEYLDGDIFIQPFAKKSSSEARLYINSESIYSKVWNITEYEEKMSYHNTEIRNKARYKNPIKNNNSMVNPKLGLFNDYDSVYFCHTVMDYLGKIDRDRSKENVDEVIRYILDNIGTKKNLIHRTVK